VGGGLWGSRLSRLSSALRPTAVRRRNRERGPLSASQPQPLNESRWDPLAPQTRRPCSLAPDSTYSLSVAEPELDPLARLRRGLRNFSRIEQAPMGRLAVWAALALFVLIPTVFYLVAVITRSPLTSVGPDRMPWPMSSCPAQRQGTACLRPPCDPNRRSATLIRNSGTRARHRNPSSQNLAQLVSAYRSTHKRDTETGLHS
jgi:hypothetical protein